MGCRDQATPLRHRRVEFAPIIDHQSSIINPWIPKNPKFPDPLINRQSLARGGALSIARPAHECDIGVSGPFAQAVVHPMSKN